MSMLNKFDYSKINHVCYSDPKQESYKKSAEFLGDTVEDWGCGTCWSKKYFTNYRGIDGTPSKHLPPENIVDLTKYTSDVDNILMRQVLELNPDWRRILMNVKKSFRKKFCLVVFTPLAETTHIGSTEKSVTADNVLREDDKILMFFNKQDILDYFPEKEFRVSEETITTEQGYGQDWILYVERIA